MPMQSAARGFWKGEQLWWRIGDEEISDRDLRNWVWHNVEGVMRYVDVIRECQVIAYANRPRSEKQGDPRHCLTPHPSKTS